MSYEFLDHVVPMRELGTWARLSAAHHILFVLGIFLLSARLRPVLAQVTTFTVAHTLTLALAVLDLPFEPAKHDTKAEGGKFTLNARGQLTCATEGACLGSFETPPEVTMMFFLRSVIFRQPLPSTTPISPV